MNGRHAAGPERAAVSATTLSFPDVDLRRTPVSQVMSPAVVVVQSSCHLGAAIDRFTGTGVRHLVVVDADGRLVGLVSHERVIAAWFDPLSRRPALVNDVVEGDGALVSPASTVQDAAHLMTALGLHALPVVHDDGLLAGVLTQTDLVALLAGTT
jgi:CBS-domain-containing membrane protein